MKHEPNGREERNSQGKEPRTRERNSQGRDPRTREQRRAKPTAGEQHAEKHVEVQHVEKNGTQCFKSGSNDKWDNKFDQDESNVIINTDQKGSCLSPRQKILRAESIGPVNTESRGQKRQGEDVEELTTKGIELSRW